MSAHTILTTCLSRASLSPSQQHASISHTHTQTHIHTQAHAPNNMPHMPYVHASHGPQPYCPAIPSPYLSLSPYPPMPSPYATPPSPYATYPPTPTAYGCPSPYAAGFHYNYMMPHLQQQQQQQQQHPPPHHQLQHGAVNSSAHFSGAIFRTGSWFVVAGTAC